jgi:CheY-like chemotaxis protein
LSISKKFIELHNGRMWVESEFGVGSSFVFELPLFSPVTPLSRPGHQIQERWAWLERRTHPRFPDSHYRPRIIVCDETGDLWAMLMRVSSEVDLVDSRTVADVIRALNDAPAQAILVNLASPEEAHRIDPLLRAHAKGTPIVGCTVQRSLDQVKRLGLQGYLTKPVTRADLARILEEFEKPIQRVLIVDDDQEVTELFRHMLYVCDSSLHIETLHNGKAALNRLRGNAPDLMLLDHLMPEMDGLQLLEAVAREEGMPKVPTYFISAQAPWDQPARSHYLYVSVDDGFSLHQLLLTALDLSQLLLQPNDRQDPGLG